MRYLAALTCVTICVASSFPQLGLPSLVSQSESIVTGKVLRTWAAWDPEHRFIWTHAEIAVDAVLKGAPQTRVIASEPGGTLNGARMIVSGSVSFTAGEQVGVFLYRTPLGFLRTVGYGQGKLDRTAWTASRSRIAAEIARQRR